MAPMLPPMVARIVTIVLRVLIVIILFASFVMVVTNSEGFFDVDDRMKWKTWHFYDSIGLGYMAAVLAIGIGYSIYGTVVMALRSKRGNDEGNLLIDFYGQKVMSNLLVTGAIAGFISVQNWYRQREQIQTTTSAEVGTFDGYWSTYSTCSGLVILAFLLSVVVSILSTHTLVKRD